MKTFKEIYEDCWAGYKQIGMKKKNGKEVPNCVPEEFVKEDQELTEFSTAQLDTLAKQYASMKDGRISIDNANKLRKIFDRIPDSALPAIRKRKIPFLSALALSRMVQKKMPVRESSYEAYADFEGVEELQEARWEIDGRVSYRGIGSEDSFHMVIDAPNESAAER